MMVYLISASESLFGTSILDKVCIFRAGINSIGTDFSSIWQTNATYRTLF